MPCPAAALLLPCCCPAAALLLPTTNTFPVPTNGGELAGRHGQSELTGPPCRPSRPLATSECHYRMRTYAYIHAEYIIIPYITYIHTYIHTAEGRGGRAGRQH
eukprot:GHVU01122943.1.p2 GENE.GHVU01122943.1~~GHVU01122943.1.p2  ORF type:complete len:103 (-),score=9.78 GHVU01122943.1:425-733(-)